jgi:hypothetical protein
VLGHGRHGFAEVHAETVFENAIQVMQERG